MAQHQSIDKRREALRRQLYGKEVMGSSPKPKIASSTSTSHQAYTFNPSQEQHVANSETVSSNYLTYDLVKILILSIFALTAQILLFFAINNHLLKLPF